MTAVVIIEAVVIVLLLVLVAGLLSSHAEILRRLHRLDGSAGPEDTHPRGARTTGLGQVPSDEIAGVGPDGSAVSVSLRHGKSDTLLAFLSTGCASCRVFWEELSDGPTMPMPDTRPVVVTKGPQAESPAKLGDLAAPHITVVMSDEAWDSFKVPVTPYFMLVGKDGNVLGEGSATTMDRLRDLFDQSAADSIPVRMTTRQREEFTDDRLGQSGIEPGDRSLYEDPLRE